MMTAAQIHLALNHFPIAGCFFTVLFLICGMIFKKRDLIFSGMLIAVLSGIGIIPMNLSGEGVEDMVKNKPGVTHELIHEHEEMAEKALIVFEIMAVSSIAWFVCRKKKPQLLRKIELVTLGLAIVSAVIIANTAHLGGVIRHEEIRSEGKQ